MTSIEICAGAGGQAIGLEQAGFDHVELVEIEPIACNTISINRPNWLVSNMDVKDFNAQKYKNEIDLFAGGVPCPPFSIAGKQLGNLDERDLFPEALRLIEECNPKAILLENVRGLLDKKFKDYRKNILQTLQNLGYQCEWRLLDACHFGVSQFRKRALLVGLKKEYYKYFAWPAFSFAPPLSIGELLYDEMASNGWEGVDEWYKKAVGIGPTLVGGSKKHGGADLGPSRARAEWAALGIDGSSLADQAPLPGFVGMPKLTLKMAALVQGFPKNWQFSGKKTSAYRQIGNAFPPPVAKAIGESIFNAIKQWEKNQLKEQAQKQSCEPISLSM